jgi:hypothetical protein
MGAGSGPVSRSAVEEDSVEEDPVEEDPVEEDPVEEDPVEEDPVEEDPVDDGIARLLRLAIGSYSSFTDETVSTVHPIPDPDAWCDLMRASFTSGSGWWFWVCRMA